MGLETSEWGLKNPKIQEFIKREDLHFDLILAEQFFQESWLMLAHKFNAPIVTISTYGYSDFFDRIMGSLTPWSFVPHTVIMHYGDSMSFRERCYNFALSAIDAAIRKFYYMPKMEDMARTYFKDLESN
jgi:glucuronosyltransferase